MENSEQGMSPSEARDVMAQAESAKARLAGGLRLPSFFYGSIGAAVAVQIATGATGIARQDALGAVLVAGGVLLFAVVAGVQLARFRRLNGAWVGGLASQVVLGTTGLASLTYVAAFGLASWAAFSAPWWSTALAAAAGGAAYTGAGQLWWRRYQGAPAEHSRGEHVVVLTLAGLLAVLFLVTLVVLR